MTGGGALRRGKEIFMEQFLRDIIEYYRDPENVKAFEEWKARQKDGEST